MIPSRLQQLLSFLETAPNDAFTLYSVAYEYLNQSEILTAIKYFEQLKSLHPEYIGTYYHLGKSLEKIKDKQAAALVYQSGIEVARKLKDRHALAELQTALNEVLFDD
ncbi:MAG: tetratricopeptide repeat protein [Bacteroidia bacterium]|nr:tetratricopeptide repeat protein [Bacteroidia bacterium]